VNQLEDFCNRVDSKVFISHSSKDKAIADAICEHLESAGTRCWIAPRDIQAGTEWTEGIMRGIASSRVFVLVFSRHANDSEHVRREVSRAFSLHLAVIPFRTEALEPRESLAYFLETVHWLDASTAPLQRHLRVLSERVKHLLEGGEGGSPSEIGQPNELKRAYTAGRKKRHWLSAVGLAGAVAVIAAALWFFLVNDHKWNESNETAPVSAIPAKSIAVLPFESLSENKEDAYFAEGVQDEILNKVAKIADLTVISRTSVMQYRAGEKRDLRQVAMALGVANVLEGTVRRNANRVRVTTELIDARQDKTTWADSFDRDLTDVFAIQSEVAQTIAAKLAATLSPEEKRNIEKKPTENIEAYDLYLQAKELLVRAFLSYFYSDVQKEVTDAIALLDRAVQLDPKFALAYSWLTRAHDALLVLYDRTPERRALGDAAISAALALEPDLSEARLAYATHLYRAYSDYERARAQLAIAKRGLPNDTAGMELEGEIDRSQGHWEKAIQDFNEALARDPGNSVVVEDLAYSLAATRQYRAAEQTFDRLIELRPNQPILKVLKPGLVTFNKTGDVTGVRAAFEALPASMADDRTVLTYRLYYEFVDRVWPRAKALIEQLNGGDDGGNFAYAQVEVPVGCYSILLARLRGEQTGTNASFLQTREELNQRVQKNPKDAQLLSQLAVVDALLNHKETAVAAAKRAVDLLPISEDAVAGPNQVVNLAVVYAWSNEVDLAFETLTPLIKIPSGVFYGELKRDVYWDPLRQDPRFEKLLAELALRD
jgi:TolB-like protein/Tfp pilus assembly protein PilF